MPIHTHHIHGKQGWTKNVRSPNPIRMDPTRTALVRRKFMADVKRRFVLLRKDVNELLVKGDAFGLKPRAVQNTRFMFHTAPEQVNAFRKWLATQIQYRILGNQTEQIEQAWWDQYVKEGYAKGAGRAFDDVRKPLSKIEEKSVSDFYAGTKSEFLRSSFGKPVAVEKVKLLSGRVFTELKGITEEMSTKLTRSLTDGLVQGQNPKVIARTMDQAIDGISRSRAMTIARTEIIRCHAEGQLDALEAMGVTEVGVMVEWATANDDRVCAACMDLENVVLAIDEARGMLPRHPNCRCAFIPANVGESESGQVRSAKSIRGAILRSVKSDRREEEYITWPGADTTIAGRRPVSLFN